MCIFKEIYADLQKHQTKKNLPQPLNQKEKIVKKHFYK